MRNSYSTIWKLMLWMGAAAVLCLWASGPAATALVQTAPNFVVPATALGFTLITAASRDRQ